MAMKALRCPQCGAELELDDSKDFGFCSSCGTKIMLNEKVKVEHTGDVRMKMDNSDQGRNRIRLGDRAYAGANYAEAYKYYTEGLEDVPDDVAALYRKGICAIWLSSADNLRIPEFVSGCSAARDTIEMQLQAAGDDEGAKAKVLELKRGFDGDLDNLATVMLESTRQCLYKCTSLSIANEQAAKWCEAAKLLQQISNYLYDETIVERLTTAGIEQCDTWLETDRKKAVSYYEKTVTDKKGKGRDIYEKFRMPDARRQAIESARQKMADRYNNLASRLEQTKELTDILNLLQTECDALESAMNEAQEKYEAAKAAFWETNPEYAARRAKTKNMRWIALAVGAVLFALGMVLSSKISVAPVAGVVALVVAFFVGRTLSKSGLTKLENELFPSDVKALGSAYEVARSKWVEKDAERKNKQSELDKFEKTKK